MSSNPFDFTQMFKAFDPADMTKMFDPKNMMSMMQAPSADMFDMTKVMENNKRNFDSLSKANQSAAAAYKDMLEKQMAIFQQVTANAQQSVQEQTGSVDVSAKTAAMNKAVEDALAMMQQMAETAREANEKAFASVQEQVANMMKSGK